MNWSLHIGDILDVPADVLICSANVHLNLSGGVGGAFALRYGRDMQSALHRYLADHKLRFVQPGQVVEAPPCGSPYLAVLHAVAVDGAYDTSADLVATAMIDGLRGAAGFGARSVALSALGTGYGRLSLVEFANALSQAMRTEFPPIERVVIGMRSRHDAEELLDLNPTLRFASAEE